MTSVLAEILAHKKEEVATKLRHGLSPTILRHYADKAPPRRGFRRALAESAHRPSLIAEIKAASPSGFPSFTGTDQREGDAVRSLRKSRRWPSGDHRGEWSLAECRTAGVGSPPAVGRIKMSLAMPAWGES